MEALFASLASLDLSRSESLAMRQLLASLEALQQPLKTVARVPASAVGAVKARLGTLFATQRNIYAALDAPDLDLGEYFGEIAALFSAIVQLARHAGELDQPAALSQWLAEAHRADAYAGAIISVKSVPDVESLYVDRYGAISFAERAPPAVLVAATVRGVRKRTEPESEAGEVRRAIERAEAAAADAIVAGADESVRGQVREQFATLRAQLLDELARARQPEGSAARRGVGYMALLLGSAVLTLSAGALAYVLWNQETVGFLSGVEAGFRGTVYTHETVSWFRWLLPGYFRPRWFWFPAYEPGVLPETFRNYVLPGLGFALGAGAGLATELATQYFDLLQRAATEGGVSDMALAGAVTAFLLVVLYQVGTAARVELRNRRR